jgi:hypothetical protein
MVCDVSHIASLPTAQFPFPNGTAVFNDAFPGVRANILTGGPEQSVVMYADGRVRTRSNDYLHRAGDNIAAAAAVVAATAVSTAEITPAPDETVESLVDAVMEAHDNVCAAGVHMLALAIKAGEALLKLKNKVGYGEFGRHLRATGINKRTAQAYMRLAKHRSEIEAKAQSVAHLGVGAALKLIAKSPADDDEAGQGDAGQGDDGANHGDGADHGGDDAGGDAAARRNDVVHVDPGHGDDDRIDGDGSTDDQDEEPAGSPLRDYWPTATIQERRDLFEGMSPDELLAVLPAHLRRGLTERLVGLNGARGAPPS